MEIRKKGGKKDWPSSGWKGIKRTGGREEKSCRRRIKRLKKSRVEWRKHSTFSPTPLSAMERDRPRRREKRKRRKEWGGRQTVLLSEKEMSFDLRKTFSIHMLRWYCRSLSWRDLGLQGGPLTEMGHRSIFSKKTWQDKLTWSGNLLSIWVGFWGGGGGFWVFLESGWKRIKYKSKAVNGDHDFDWNLSPSPSSSNPMNPERINGPYFFLYLPSSPPPSTIF